MNTSRTDESATTPARSGRGRPRDTSLDDEILAAAASELIDHGFSGLTIEGVALRAGVAKTTVYRRWSDASDLALAAARRVKAEISEPPPGSVRDQLVWLLDRSRAQWSDPRWVAMMRRVAADGTTNPEVYEEHRNRLIAPHSALMRAVVQRGVDEGILRDDIDPDWIRLLLIAPVIATGMTLRPVPSEEQIRANVDLVLRGAAP